MYEYENGEYVLTERYEYDDLNQLSRADIRDTGKTTTYWYDRGGNIGSRIEYPCTTKDYVQVQIAEKRISCGYGDSSWKDLLTSYDGQTITYDGMGNPLNYRDGITLTWKNGRQLASSTVGDIVTTYNYDISGNRVYRAGGGFRHTYHVVDGVALGEKIVFVSDGTTHYMKYMRDENGDKIFYNKGVTSVTPFSMGIL